MRFANSALGILLGSFIFYLFFTVPSTVGQEELLDENAEPTSVDGIFDDELEPLDEEDISRPIRGGSRRDGRRGDEDNRDFDEARIEDEDEGQDEEEFTPRSRPRRFSRPSRSRSITRSRAGTGTGRGNLAFPTYNYAEDIPNRTEKLRMDFIQRDIEEVVKFFAERLRKRFIYDPSILSGKITIISPTEVTVEEAYQAFMSALEIRGYVVYPSGRYFKIEKVNNARKSPVPLYVDGSPDDDSFVTRIINLKYLNVGDIRRAVNDLVSRVGGDVIEHAPTNTLIITDYAANIRRIVRILNLLDVEGFQEQIVVISLQYASATEVARKINEIFPTGNQATTRRSSRRRRRRSRRSRNTAQESGVIQKVVADERTNSLIILGSERGIEQVQKFIEKIDVAIEGGDGSIHVYALQNVKAEDISQTLASLTQSTSSNTRNTRSTRRTRRSRRNTRNTNSGPRAASLFDGEVKITADTKSNSLVIQSSARDFEVLKGLIQKLDIRRRQVFIESVILETQVGGLSEFGTQARGPFTRTKALGADNPGDGADNNGAAKSTGVFGFGGLGESFQGTLQGLLGSTAITGLALGFQSGGTIGVPVPNSSGGTDIQQVPILTAVIRLAATNSNVNVLSTPHIIATANETANISIGEEIPQIASTQPAASGSPISTFNRIRVATELEITPQINAGDYLTLGIKQKVNDRGEEVIQGQFATTTREANTTAIVKDGQTIVIGGIMRDVKRESITKVPFLGDIPILGWLFKSRNARTEKRNLLLFITPHIIRDTADMNDVFFRRLRQREHFLDQVGLEEKQGIPVSGMSPEDLQFLDDEYVKSLELRPLPSQLPADSQEEDQNLQNGLPVVEPTPNSQKMNEPSMEPERIPILPPADRGDEYYDEQELNTEELETEELDSKELDTEEGELPPLELSEPDEQPNAFDELPTPLPIPEPEFERPLEQQQGYEEPEDEQLEELEIPELEELELPPSNQDTLRDTMDSETQTL